MTTLLMRPLRHLVQGLVANDSPRQVATGFTLGMLIGLIPKGNLIILVLTLLLCALRVNKPAGLMAAACFSLVGLFFDPFTHQLGALVLVHETIRPLHRWLYELPLGPWLGMNNTVVVGQLLIGIYLVFPTYWLTNRFVCKVQPRMTKWLLRYKVIRWLRGTELGSHWGIEA
ncbi:MAG: TIGR03546 family protein [Pirellulales bacterium]|nr:TIGR03546 family protein [Pirellulales bacterium]